MLHIQNFSGISASRPFQSLASVPRPSTEVTVALILIILCCLSTCSVKLPKKISSIPWQDSWGTSLTSSATQCLLKETQWRAPLAGRGEVGAAHEDFCTLRITTQEQKKIHQLHYLAWSFSVIRMRYHGQLNGVQRTAELKDYFCSQVLSSRCWQVRNRSRKHPTTVACQVTIKLFCSAEDQPCQRHS